MAIELGINQVLSKLFTDIVKSGFEKYFNNKEAKDSIQILRESLARELRLAIELLEEQKSQGDDALCEPKVFIECVEMESFETIARSGFPLSKIIDIVIDEDFWANLNLNKEEKNFVRLIKSGDVLLERTYLRLKIHKIRLTFNGRKTKISYLKKLIRASLKALKQSE